MDTPGFVLVAQSWARRHHIEPLAYECPDKHERRVQAVDLLGRDKAGHAQLVLEHTLVESFPGQRSQQRAAINMFQPLEEDLSGQLPGSFKLVLSPRSVLGLKSRVARIRSWVTDWVWATAPTLAVASRETSPHHIARTTVPDSNLTVTLSRWPGRKSALDLCFDCPEDPMTTLAECVEKAFEDKCPKLAAAKAASIRVTSLLVLEIDDDGLGDLFGLDVAVGARLEVAERDLPDDVWLVDSAHRQMSVVISRESGKRIADIRQRYFPFALKTEGECGHWPRLF